MNIQDKVKQMVDNAPVISSGVNVNFGPLTVTPIVKTFHGKGQKPTVQTLDEFAKSKGVTVDDVELGTNDAFNLRFTIDVSDLNESLDFKYEREIPVIESSNKVKTDWAEIVLPSLIATFGAEWTTKLLPSGKKPAPIIYVAAENVDSLRVGRPAADGTAPKNYGVPKFIGKYATRDECVKARDARYPKATAAEEEEEVAEGEFSEEVLDQVRSLLAANKGNVEKTKKMLERKPFGDYDADELLVAATEETDESDE